MVNFHGANKPAGEPRTWPNEMTREGIRGLEYNKWSELPAYHYAVLPFTRMLAGHGDFTPTTFQKHMLKGTTVTGQLAHAVVYTSPFLCWADKPDVYLNSPVVDLIRVMPTTWDETHVLPGSQIGVLAVFARRAGEEWWIGGINGADHDMEYALKPTFLENRRYTATVVADNEYDSDELVLEKIEITQGATKSIKMRKGGGFVLRLQRP
jgi:alpha-glucosidase